MTHFYERNIVEIKNIYTSSLVNIITPLLYEGIKSVYQGALKIEKKFQEREKNDPNVENPGILKIFQLCLKDIPGLNQHEIETESNRIKERSKCSEWFDELVKAVIKSHIVLLTYNASGKTCKLVKEKHHETVDTHLFIHKCYIESARMFYNYPELFWHQYSSLDLKRNQREAHDLIKTSINEAIKKMLPIKLILQEYLSNDYIREIEENVGEHISESQYMNLKSMVHRDLNNDEHVVNIFDDGTGKHSRIIDTSDDLEIEEENKEFEKELEDATRNMDLNKDILEYQQQPNPEHTLNKQPTQPNPEHILNKQHANNIQLGGNINHPTAKENQFTYLTEPKSIKQKKGDTFKEMIGNVNAQESIQIKQNKQQKQKQLNPEYTSNKQNKQNIILDNNDSDDNMNINVVRTVGGSDVGAFFENYLH